MAEHNDRGDRGEALAVSFLKRKGFFIIHRNWRFGKSEIDIIARDRHELVFIEVKSRRTEEYGAPERAITRRKQQLICRAADVYLKRFPSDHVRFDTIAVLFDERPIRIRHTQDAFYPLVRGR